jgi:hypothetical protein
MKHDKHALFLASALLLMDSAAFGQQQFDSRGSPTPASKQNASPNATGPNVPMPADQTDIPGKAATEGSGSFTTGASASQQSSAKGGANNPDPTGVNGTTPSGLTPD